MRGKPKKAPATAAGQLLGYSLQFTRLTEMLLKAKEGSICSLEVIEDVAEETQAGITKLSQTKSLLTTNPVADHAVSLWKTISNWLRLIEGNYVDPKVTIFELYTSKIVEGQIINSFNSTQSIEEAKLAIKNAREVMWGEAPGYDKKVYLPEGLQCYVNHVLGADEEILIPIIINLHLECGSGSPQSDIEAIVRTHPVSEKKVYDIADKLCGWVKRQADKQLEKGLPTYISRDDFHSEYTSYVRMVDRDQILKSMAKSPSPGEQLERLPDIFVQQLDLIEFSFEDKLSAISDFLRACWDRVHWSKTGDIHEDSFTELDDNLCRTWQNLNRIASTNAATRTAIECGKILHSQCMLHQVKVQGMEPPSHFVPGCFHRLADDMVIGWHPEYRDLLKKGGSGQ